MRLVTCQLLMDCPIVLMNFMKRLRISCFIMPSTFPFPGSPFSYLIWGQSYFPCDSHLNHQFRQGKDKLLRVSFASILGSSSNGHQAPLAYEETSFCHSYILTLSSLLHPPFHSLFPAVSCTTSQKSTQTLLRQTEGA